MRDLESLLLGFDRAGPADDDEAAAAHRDAAHRHDGRLPLGLPRDELVWGRDRNDLEDAREILEGRRLDGAPVAGDSDRRPLRAGNRMGLQSEALDGFDDAPHLLRGGGGVHDDQHRGAII